MKFREISSFQKYLKNVPLTNLCMIIGKESEEPVQLFLAHCGIKPFCISSDLFDAKVFMQEVETRPFLSQRTCVHIKNIELLSTRDIPVLMAYIKAPNEWVSLLLTGEALPPKNPLIVLLEQQGVVLLLEEKPWEREKRIAAWLLQQASIDKVKLSMQAALSMVRNLGEDSCSLKNELDKLICFVGEKKIIQDTDLQSISTKTEQQTLWKLGDALFIKDFKTAYHIGCQLLDSMTPLFTLLAHLRTQVITNMAILEILQHEGREKVASQFPYLKGATLEKKIEMVQNYGLEGFKNTFIYLFETELSAKNSSNDPKCYFESFIFKLSYALPASKSARCIK